MKKIAVITNIVYEMNNCGNKAGGGAVVTANLISMLSKMPDIDLYVFARHSYASGNLSYKLFIIDEPTFQDFLDSADEIIKSEKIENVVTLNIHELYKNNVLQAHSFMGRCKKTNFIVRHLKMLLGRKKLNFEKNIYSRLNYNNKFIAMSKAVKDDYSANFKINPNNIKVVYPGCMNVFETAPDIEKKDKITFGIVANSSVNKGGYLFMLAAGIAKCLGCKFNIKIIAPKFENDIFMKFLTKVFGLRKNISVLPKQDDMTNFYKSIDVLVLPSYNEAFGLVVIEAGAFGKPSIISSAAGVSEIIADNSGFIFKAGAVFSLLSAIKRTCRMYNEEFDLYKESSKKAFELSKQYSWDKFALEILRYI